MENFNKVLSFFLGLIVVIVFVIVLSNRLNLRKNFIPFQTKKITPTKVASETKGGLTPTLSPKPTESKKQAPKEAKKQVPMERLVIDNTATPTPAPKIVAKNGSQKPTRIPATGSPTLLLPIVAGAFFLGRKLRAVGKN